MSDACNKTLLHQCATYTQATDIPRLLLEREKLVERILQLARLTRAHAFSGTSRTQSGACARDPGAISGTPHVQSSARAGQGCNARESQGVLALGGRRGGTDISAFLTVLHDEHVPPPLRRPALAQPWLAFASSERSTAGCAPRPRQEARGATAFSLVLLRLAGDQRGAWGPLVSARSRPLVDRRDLGPHSTVQRSERHHAPSFFHGHVGKP